MGLDIQDSVSLVGLEVIGSFLKFRKSLRVISWFQKVIEGHFLISESHWGSFLKFRKPFPKFRKSFRKFRKSFRKFRKSFQKVIRVISEGHFKDLENHSNFNLKSLRVILRSFPRSFFGHFGSFRFWYYIWILYCLPSILHPFETSLRPRKLGHFDNKASLSVILARFWPYLTI